MVIFILFYFLYSSTPKKEQTNRTRKNKSFGLITEKNNKTKAEKTGIKKKYYKDSDNIASEISLESGVYFYESDSSCSIENIPINHEKFSNTPINLTCSSLRKKLQEPIFNYPSTNIKEMNPKIKNRFENFTGIELNHYTMYDFSEIIKRSVPSLKNFSLPSLTEIYSISIGNNLESYINCIRSTIIKGFFHVDKKQLLISKNIHSYKCKIKDEFKPLCILFPEFGILMIRFIEEFYIDNILEVHGPNFSKTFEKIQEMIENFDRAILVFISSYIDYIDVISRIIDKNPTKNKKTYLNIESLNSFFCDVLFMNRRNIYEFIIFLSSIFINKLSVGLYTHVVSFYPVVWTEKFPISISFDSFTAFLVSYYHLRKADNFQDFQISKRLGSYRNYEIFDCLIERIKLFYSKLGYLVPSLESRYMFFGLNKIFITLKNSYIHAKKTNPSESSIQKFEKYDFIKFIMNIYYSTFLKD